METEGTVKRKRRKRSNPKTALKWRGHKGKKPGTAEAHKKLWADPTYRAMMMEKRKAAGERRRGTGIGSRTGIPDGMRKPEADRLNAEAKESAANTMSELREAGVLNGEDPRAEEALEFSIQLMRAPGSKDFRLKAAKQVLEYTKTKPATKINATVDTAEAWLKAVTAQNDQLSKSGADAPDAKASS